MKRLLNSRILAAVGASLALAGCGGSSEQAATPDQQYVVMSAVDCADNTGMDYDTCAGLLQKAIDEHDKQAPSYTKLADCEKAEGQNRCDRIAEKSYRARIAAFQITMSEEAVAIPLYPTKKETAGFRTAANTEVVPDAENFTFTKSAADATHLFAVEKKNGKK